MAGGTAVMPELSQGTDAFTRLVSLRHAGLGEVRIDGRPGDGSAPPRRWPTSRRSPALAFLAPALARHRLADDPQHGDRRRQPLRPAALRRPRRLPDRARGGRDRLRRRRDAARSRSRRWPPTASPPARSSPRSPSTCPPPARSASLKAGRKALNAAAIVTVAAVVREEAGKVAACRIGLGGVAPTRGAGALGRGGAPRPAARPGGGGGGRAGGRSRTSTPSTTPMPAPGTAGG